MVSNGRDQKWMYEYERDACGAKGADVLCAWVVVVVALLGLVLASVL